MFAHNTHHTQHALQIFACAAFIAGEAAAAEIMLPIRASIISYSDVVKICGAESAPAWCPQRLRPQIANDPHPAPVPRSGLDNGQEYTSALKALKKVPEIK